MHIIVRRYATTATELKKCEVLTMILKTLYIINIFLEDVLISSGINIYHTFFGEAGYSLFVNLVKIYCFFDI